MSGLRVLEAITPSRIGGAEVFVAELCCSFAELGAHVEVFCPTGRPFVGYARARGIEPISWRTFGKLDPITVIRLAGLMKRRRIDVIHTHLSTASLLGAFAAKLARRRSVAHVHGLNTATCFRYSDLVIAVSECAKAHLVSQGLDEKRVRVVHDGVDVVRFAPTNAREAKIKLGCDPDEPLLGVFGRLSSEKGQRVALEAMFLIVKDYPDARLALVGEGRDREELETCAQALGLGGGVVFTGFVEDVREMMSACDIVLVPSVRGEGFGLAAVEAMALARPVIASAQGGLPEIVVANETGLLVPRNDPKALADAACELLANPDLAQDMGAKGRARVEQHFALGEQMRKVLDILDFGF
jgi:glycosyltransferase involved in cell wall biosynthesis